MRTHALFQSGPLLQEVVRLSPVRTDVSLFLPGAPVVGPLIQHVASPTLIRLPYSWEDDDEMSRPQPCWDHKAFLSTVRPVIFDFHPIYIHLNSSSAEAYRELKSRRSSLTDLRERDVEEHINQGAGTGSMFGSLVLDLQPQTSLRVSDLVKQAMGG